MKNRNICCEYLKLVARRLVPIMRLFMFVWRLRAPASTVREASWPSLMVFRGLSKLLTPSTRL